MSLIKRLSRWLRPEVRCDLCRRRWDSVMEAENCGGWPGAWHPPMADLRLFDNLLDQKDNLLD